MYGLRFIRDNMTKRIEHITEEGVEKKRCCTCQTYRSLDNFNNCKNTWDNLRPECKICISEKREANKEKKHEYNKQYWEKTKDVQREKSRKWRENNKDHVKQKMEEWLELNKDYKKQKDKEYRINNWERRKETHTAWRKKDYEDMKTNPERQEEFNNKRIKSNVSRRIREILKQGKSERSHEYVGCSLEKLKEHLQSLFQEGMTWDNYGTYKTGNHTSGWHIDHIIPCAAFDFESTLETRACFHYTNLQPLWGKDNIIKKDTYDVKEKEEHVKKYIEMVEQKVEK